VIWHSLKFDVRIQVECRLAFPLPFLLCYPGGGYDDDDNDGNDDGGVDGENADDDGDNCDDDDGDSADNGGGDDNSGNGGDDNLFKHVTPWSLCYNLIGRARLGS
jgi:hypothetical protein